MSTRPAGVVHEHAVLCRHLGAVQDRVSSLMQEQDKALKALATEVVQLRGQLVVARTRLLWGMPLPTVIAPEASAVSNAVSLQTAPPADMEAARKAICQTGCTGHAHPWLTGEGQCRWSGRVCDGGGG